MLASGETVIASAAADEYPDLFWALKGGGGGNFGVVTRFKFKLASLLPVTTYFALRWKDADNVIAVMKLWTVLHAKMDAIDPVLSTACGMLVAETEPEKGKTKGTVHLRMGGLFYGSKTKLLTLLNAYFEGYIPKKFVSLIERPENYSENKKKTF